MRTVISYSKDYRSAALLIGLIVIAASSIPALLAPANAAAQLHNRVPKHAHPTPSIRPKTRQALLDAYDAVQQGNFAQAHTILGNAIDGFAPSGQRSDYFVLHAADLKTYAFEGQFDPYNAGYLQWMQNTPTEQVANEFLSTALAAQQFDAILAAADRLSAASGSGAAARLAVGAIEAELAQGHGAALVDAAWLGEVAKTVRGHELSEQIFLSLWSGAPRGKGNPTQAQAASAIAEAYGVENLDAAYLLNWAFLNLAEEDSAAALDILELAKPLIMDNSQDARWNWAYANVLFNQGFLPEALWHANIVAEFAADQTIDVGLDLAQQVEILRGEIRRAADERGETLEPDASNAVQSNHQQADPCEKQVTQAAEDGGGVVVDNP